MSSYTSGEIAEETDVSIHTVRYYEEKNLLPPVPRTSAGQRRFDEEHVAHIRFIKRAKRLGFTLREIRELLGLRATSESGEQVRQKTEAKIEEVENKIADLRRIRQKLVELADVCEVNDSTEKCLVLHALEGSDGEGPVDESSSPAP